MGHGFSGGDSVAKILILGLQRSHALVALVCRPVRGLTRLAVGLVGKHLGVRPHRGFTACRTPVGAELGYTSGLFASGGIGVVLLALVGIAVVTSFVVLGH
jgi:hypothetical protein